MMYEFYYSDLDNKALIQARVEQEAEALHQHRQHDDPTSPPEATIYLSIQGDENCQS